MENDSYPKKIVLDVYNVVPTEKAPETPPWVDDTDPGSFMNLAGEEIVDRVGIINDERKKYHARNPGICMCGHSMNGHTDDVEPDGQGGYVHTFLCKVGRVTCSCQYPRLVLLTDDARLFMHTTYGPAENHALFKGLGAVRTAGKHYRWNYSSGYPVCDICKLDNKQRIYPMPISRDFGMRTNHPGGGMYTIWTCRNCQTIAEDARFSYYGAYAMLKDILPKPSTPGY